MLESAIAAPYNDDRDTQHNLSAAEQYIRRRREHSLGDHVAVTASATANEASLTYIPRIPEWLNHARAQEIPPGVPALPRSNIPQGQPPTESTVPAPQLDPGTVFRPGQPILARHQFERAVPSALGTLNPPAHDPAMSNTFGSMPVHFERARGGGRSTIVPFQPDYDHYERAAGKRLPFPDISSLLRNENMPLL